MARLKASPRWLSYSKRRARQEQVNNLASAACAGGRDRSDGAEMHFPGRFLGSYRCLPVGILLGAPAMTSRTTLPRGDVACLERRDSLLLLRALGARHPGAAALQRAHFFLRTKEVLKKRSICPLAWCATVIPSLKWAAHSARGSVKPSTIIGAIDWVCIRRQLPGSRGPWRGAKKNPGGESNFR